MNYIDLHMHSNVSYDGEFSPSEIVKKCFDSGIKIMAISDHNFVKAIEEEKEVCEKYGIIFIPAIEIDCRYKGLNFHVLGYGVSDASFNKIGDDFYKANIVVNEKLVEMTEKLGFEIDRNKLDRLATNGLYFGEIFAELLLNDPKYYENEILKPYRNGGKRADNPYVNFYWDYYSLGKPCYAEVDEIDIKEAIKMIHKYNGKAVLAHPGINLKNNYELFDEIVKEGIDGVEVFSSYHDKKTCQYFLNKAKQHGLMITAGSDFHGKTKKSIKIGGTNCFINQKEIEEGLIKAKLI